MFLLIFIFLNWIQLSLGCIASPKSAMTIRVQNKDVASGDDIQVIIMINSATPNFNSTLSMDGLQISSFNIYDNFKASNKTLTLRVPRTGKKNLTLNCQWLGAPFSMSEMVYVYKPIEEEDFNFSILNTVIFPPGISNLNLKIYDSTELPTNVTGTIDWGDGTDISNLNYINSTLPRASGTVGDSLTHIYKMVGSYTLKIKLMNPISSVTKTNEIKVHERIVIKGISIKHVRKEYNKEKPSEYFRSSEDLLFSTTVKSGIIKSFHFEVERRKYSFRNPPVKHRFRSSGTYGLKMWATGDAGISNIVRRTIFVQRIITLEHVDLKIQNPLVIPPGVASLTVGVTDLTELPTSLQGKIIWNSNDVTNFDWRDETSYRKRGTVSNIFNHNFDTPGNYSIKVWIANEVSQTTAVISTIVIPKPVADTIYVSHSPEIDDEEDKRNVFSADEEVYFKMDFENGDPHHFHLEIDGKKKVAKTLPISYTLKWAGKYSLNMWVTSEAGKSNVINRTIEIERSLRMDQLTLEIESLIITPPGIGTLQITVEDNEELPTAVSGEIVWEQNSTTYFDWKRYTAPGRLGYLSAPFSHIYQVASNYTISVSMLNRVSKITKYVTTRVISQLVIELIYVTYEPNFINKENDVFASNKMLFFTTDLLDGIPNLFLLEVESNNISASELPLNYTFSQAGTYPINMWCTGEAGVSNVLSRIIHVQKEVFLDQIHLQATSTTVIPNGLTNLDITVTDDYELPTNISCIITWEFNVVTKFDWKSDTDAGSKGKLSHRFQHKYTNASTFNISVEISNRVSSATKTIEAFVVWELIVNRIYVSHSETFDTNQSVFSSNKRLYFRTDLMSGEPDLFHLEIDGNNQTSSTLPMFYTIKSAGMYEILMWASGAAGLSNIFSRTISVEREIKKNHVTLRIPDIIVTPPGLANLSVSISDNVELPTRVNGNITWEETGVDHFNWKEETAAGVKGILTKLFTHIYKTPNNYSVSVELFNNVSSVTITTHAYVIPHLTMEGIFVSDSLNASQTDKNITVFPSNEELYFRTVLTSGYPSTFHLEVNGGKETIGNLPISYIFPMAGIYVIKMWARGEAGISNIVERTLTIQRIINKEFISLTLPQIIITPPGIVEVNVTLDAATELPTHMVGVVDWNDTKTETFDWISLTNPGMSEIVQKTFQHFYEIPKNYSIVFTLSNNVSSAFVKTEAFVVPKLEIKDIIVSDVSLDNTKAADRVFETNFNLTIETNIANGDASKFHLKIEGKGTTLKLESKNLPFWAYFNQSGIYTLTLWMEGLAGDSNKVSYDVLIQSKIFGGGVRVLDPPEQHPGYPWYIGYKGMVSFTLEIYNPTEAPRDVEMWVDWADNSTHKDQPYSFDPGSDEKSLQKFLSHVYTKPGNYAIIIKLENEVSSHIYPINVIVVPKLGLQGIVVDFTEGSHNQSQNNCKDTFALENGEMEIKPGSWIGVPLSWELKIICETCEWEQEQQKQQQEISNKNVTTKWIQKTNESDGIFNFKFNSPGWYELVLSVFGFDNDTATTSRRIFLGEYVTTLFIQIYPNVTRKNFTTVVAFRSSWVYGSCLIVNLGDGTEESLFCDEIRCESEYSSRNYTTRPPNPDVIIKHAYLLEDYFYVSAKLVGPINTIEESASVSVEPDDTIEICSNLRIEIEKAASRANPFKIRKKDTIRLVSKAEISGSESCDQVTSIIEWRIRQNNDSSSNILPFVTTKTLDDISDDQELLRNVPVNNPILLIPGKTLPYGLYYITVSYTFRLTIHRHHINKASPLKLENLKENSEIAENGDLVNISTTLIDVTVVLVEKSDLIAKMINSAANLVLRGSNQTIKLEPEVFSFDPDGVSQVVGFTWWCKKKNEEWTDNIQTGASIPSQEKEGEDLGGCFGDGPSKFDYVKGSLELPCHLFIEIPGYYTMLVEVTSDEKIDPRKRNATLDLEIVPGSPPVLTASCNPEKSCTFIDGVVSVNPIKLVLRSSCVYDEGNESQDRLKTIDLGDDGCGKPPVSYEWVMTGINEDNTTTVLDLTEHAVGVNRFNFALLDSFWDSDMGNYMLYEIKVFGAREGELYKGKTMLMMRRNFAPENGTCVIIGVNVGSFYNEKVCGLRLSEATNNTKTIPAITGNSTFSSPISNDTDSFSPFQSPYHRDNTSFHIIYDYSNINFTNGKNESEDPFWSDEEGEVVHVAALTDEVKVDCPHWVDREGRGVKRYKISIESTSGKKTPLWSGNQFPAIITLPYDDIRLIGEIFDDQEAVAVFNFREKLSMHLPDKHIYDCYDNSSILSEAQRRQQISKVNMLLHAEKTVKPHMGQVAENSGKNAEFVSSLDKFPTTNIDEVLQATSILSTVAHPLPPGNFQDTAINSLKNLAGKTSSEGASPNLQKEFASTSLQTVASLLKNTNEDDETFNQRSPTNVRLRTDKSKQSEVENMMGVIEGSQENILGVAVVGEAPEVVDVGDTVAMAVGFFDASDLEGTEVNVDGAIYVFPNYCDLLQLEEDCLANKTISIGLKMAKWTDQVYGFGGGRDLLSEESSTVQLSLVDTWGNVVPVKDSRSPIIINIPRKASEFPEADLITPNMTRGQKFFSHKVDINAEGVGVSFYFRPEDFSAEWIITTSFQPPYANETNVTFYRLNELTYHKDIGFYGILLVWEDLACTNCSVFFGVAIENSTSTKDMNSIDGVVDKEYLQETFTQNYSIITFTSSCLFFDKETTSWDSKGCQVLNATTTLTVCACNHLTSFGSGFVVAPNVIDFSYVFANAGFSQNMTIYLTLIVMACLFIIGLVYSGIMDMKDKKKIGASPLPDNDPRDKYLYDIFVQTGSFPNSGTESKVNFLISGEWEDTGVRELRDPERKALQRGNKDHFVMTTPRPLGPLQYLRIWHDNSGKGSKASWFFGYMIIRDIQTGDEFQFISNEWLAVEEGDGQIDRTIPLAGDSEMKAYSHLFRNTVERKLSDDHLWLSVFLRPPRSRFSRKERLSSVVALLFLSMLTSAMFYDKVPDEPGAGAIHVGPFSISPESLGVGFFTNIIVFFPTFIIITFFRKSRRRKVKPSRINQALLRQRAEKMLEMEKKEKKIFEREMKEIEEERKRKEIEKQNIASKLGDEDPLINKEDVKSTTSSEKSQKYYEVKRSKKFRLPWWCRIIAWLLVVASIGSSVFFLWAYGIMFGDEKVKKWLTSVAVSIVTSMFITQPIKIYLLAVVFSVIFKTPLNEAEDYDDDEELMPLEYDEEYVHKMDSKKDKKKKKRIKIGSIYSEEQLKEVRLRREKEVAMNKLIAEILLYLVFLTVVLCISYGSRNPLIIFMKLHYEDLFGKQHNQKSPPFLGVKSRGDIWNWAEHVFIPNIANVYLYNNVSKAFYSPQFKGIDMVDQTVTVLGKAIFRQTRIEPGNCELKNFLKTIDQSDAPKTCSGFSSIYDEQETNYTKGWKPYNRTVKCERCDACEGFIYRSPFKVQGFPYSGRLSTYGGGGYVIELNHKDITCALRQIRELRKHRWLDEYTRGFFAEIAIYNPNINLFGVIMCVAEFLPGDGIYPVFEFQALNIYRYHAGGGLFLMISEILFVIFTIYFIRREHAVFKKIGKKYFDSYWNWMEIMVIGLSLVIIVFYTIKSLYSIYLMDRITESKGKKYIRLQSLATFDETTTFLIGFLLFIATVKLLKLLRFNKRIGFLSETLRACGTDLSGFALLFIVTLISFVTVFYKEAVTASAEFSTFIRAAETSTFKIAEKFKDVTQVSPVVAPIFYFIFAFIMNWIVLQVLIAIICGTFSRIKKDLSAQPNDYEVVDYMIERFLNFLSTINFRKNKVYNRENEKKTAVEKLMHINSFLDQIIIILEKMEDDDDDDDDENEVEENEEKDKGGTINFFM